MEKREEIGKEIRISVLRSVLAGCLTTVLSVITWTLFTFITHSQYGISALVVGVVMGLVVRTLGRGDTPMLGVIAASLTALSVLLGNFFGMVAIMSVDADLPLTESLAWITTDDFFRITFGGNPDTRFMGNLYPYVQLLLLLIASVGAYITVVSHWTNHILRRHTLLGSEYGSDLHIGLGVFLLFLLSAVGGGLLLFSSNRQRIDTFMERNCNVVNDCLREMNAVRTSMQFETVMTVNEAKFNEMFTRYEDGFAYVAVWCPSEIVAFDSLLSVYQDEATRVYNEIVIPLMPDENVVAPEDEFKVMDDDYYYYEEEDTVLEIVEDSLDVLPEIVEDSVNIP